MKHCKQTFTKMEGVRKKVNEYFANAEPFKVATTSGAVTLAAVGLGYFLLNREEVIESAKTTIFSTVRSIPGVSGALEKEKQNIAKDLAGTFSEAGGETIRKIPEKGWTNEKIMEELKRMSAIEEKKWSSGKVSGCVYHGGTELIKLQSEAYALFALSNPLHSDVFPCVRKMESDIIKMTADMLHGTRTTVGVVTSGGTESIIMAMKAYRDRGRAMGIKHAEIIASVSAHPAFDKAAGYFGMKLVKIRMKENFEVDIEAVKAAITSNTVVIVGSAPQFPYGVIDNIVELAAIAKSRGIGFHTDACLGGFFLPWARLKHPDRVPPFDFEVPGVTSISCDTHKYGFATKGTSVLLFENPEIRRNMYFVTTDWPGGTYASPSIAGSRPGGLVACCWTAMISTGKEKYIQHAEEIWTTVQNIKEAIHIAITVKSAGKEQEFSKDLKESVEIVKNRPDKKPHGSAAMYGMANSFPDRTVIADVATTFIDTALDA